MNKSAYQLGCIAALDKLRIKTAIALPKGLARTVGGGALFGGTTGALMAPEGETMQGALRGAAMGGAGAGLGHLAGAAAYGRPMKRLQGAKAKTKAHGARVPKEDGPQLSLTHMERGPDAARLKRLSKMEKDLTERATRNTRGAAMLGGALGAGVAADSTNARAQYQPPQGQNPYRYPMR